MPPRRPLPDEIVLTASRQEGLVDTEQCRRAGLGPDVVRRLLTTSAWSRVTRGVYDTDPRPVARRPADRRRRRAAWAAMLAFGPRAIAVGPCALALLGVSGLPSRVVPEAALPGGRALESRDGIRLRMFDDGMTVVRVGDRHVASPEWALAQAVPELDREPAVSVMDSALHLGLVDPSGLDRAHDHARGRRGGGTDARVVGARRRTVGVATRDVGPARLRGRRGASRRAAGRAHRGERCTAPGGPRVAARRRTLARR